MTPGGEMADSELFNEQLMRDAKQQGNQGNLVMVRPHRPHAARVTSTLGGTRS